tara:strand:+ start:1008 stop:1181 length:174 start_codon:yes stop_codon:yes gene_type:complete
MTFVLQIAVPTESDGWTGADHLPTLTVEATSRTEAKAKVEALIAHLPDGTTFTLFAV